MKKTTEYRNSILEQSKELQESLKEKRGMGDLTPSFVNDMKEHILRINSLRRDVEHLSDRKRAKAAMESLIKSGMPKPANWDQLTHSKKVAYANWHGVEMLEKTMEKAGGTIDRSEKSVESFTAKRTSEQTVAAEKGEGFLKNMLDKHNKMLEGKSSGAKMGIAVAETAGGAMLTLLGGKWLTQAMDGRRRKKVEQFDEANGVHYGTAVIMEPMSSSDRVLKAALGIGGLVAGIGAVSVGLTNLSRPH